MAWDHQSAHLLVERCTVAPEYEISTPPGEEMYYTSKHYTSKYHNEGHDHGDDHDPGDHTQNDYAAQKTGSIVHIDETIHP
jgi:hypothetical protein